MLKMKALKFSVTLCLLTFLLFWGLGMPVSAFARTAQEEYPLQDIIEEIKGLEEETSRLLKKTEEHTEFIEQKTYGKPLVQMRKDIKSLDKRRENLQKARRMVEEEIINLKRTSLKTYKDVLQKDREITKLRTALDRDKCLDNNRALEQELMRLKDEMGGVYYQLGAMHTEQDDYHEAIKFYERSIEYGTQSPEIYYHLGLLYEYVKSDSRKAVSYLTKYLKLNPDTKNVKKVKKLIELMR